MIDGALTRAHKPAYPGLVDGVFLGAVSQVLAPTTISMKTRIYDNFSSGVDDWINVRGRLATSGGSTPDITADTRFFDPLSYVVGAAGYHRTEMLSDNIRVKVTVPDGLIINGTSYFWFCGDTAMTHYYGIRISTGLGLSNLSIIKGTSPNSWQIFEVVGASLSSGDSIEGWYDRPNSTLRMYHNGATKGTLPVEPTEIPHGPGRRWCGVIMASDWWIAPGGNFADFEAWDV